MKIFLSYPSGQKDAAETICYALQAEGHEVFFDKEDLPPGESFDVRIRDALEASDLFIFVITPESVEQGRYTLSEQKIASRKWPNPTGRVLPVMLEPTPIENIPAYLKAVTILTPEGNASAEILLEVAQLAGTTEPARRVKIQEVEAELPALSYRPLEIRFGAGTAGAYPVGIASSPAGTRPAQPCALDPDNLERLLWASAQPVRGSVRRGGAELAEEAVTLLPSPQDAQRTGQEIHEILFGSHIQDCINASLRTVDPQHGDGLRFLINTTDAPDLARVPWEFVFSPREDDFLFSDRMKPVVRWLDVDAPLPTLAVQPPLRLLTAVASPTSRPELRVGEELEHLDEALQDLTDDGLIQVRRLDHTTLERLDDALLTFRPHLLHFIGHGDFVDDDGVIVLEAAAPEGAADPITGRRLGVLLRNHLASLRFVFLNSCLGAASSRRDPFGGVAQSLIRRGLPAVVAMQFPIPDNVAVSLARHFYRYLAAGLPVDAALTSARAFLFASGHGVEWGAPALHMRTADGRLFDFEEEKPPSGQAPPSVPGPLPEPAAPPEAEEPAVAYEPPRSVSAPAAAPRRRWLWVVLGVLVLLAAVFFAVPAYKEGSPPDPGDTTAIPPVPDRPIVVDEAPILGVLYGQAADALDRGDYTEALRLIDAIKREDPDGVVVLTPEFRVELLDGLARAARARLAEGELEDADRFVREMLRTDPNNASALALAAEIEELIGDDVLPVPVEVPVEPEPVVEPAPVRGHRVVVGDTLWDISAATYGDPTRWPEVYEANRDQIADPDLIFPDQQLTLPPLRAPTQGVTPAAGAYRVQKGDTLWDIAAEAYGDPLLWPRIHELNRERIADPDLIFPGQQFSLPQNLYDQGS